MSLSDRKPAADDPLGLKGAERKARHADGWEVGGRWEADFGEGCLYLCVRAEGCRGFLAVSGRGGGAVLGKPRGEGQGVW
jgi:hypothetical protein